MMCFWLDDYKFWIAQLLRSYTPPCVLQDPKADLMKSNEKHQAKCITQLISIAISFNMAQ